MKQLLILFLWLPLTILVLTTSFLFYSYRNTLLTQELKLQERVLAVAPVQNIPKITDIVPQVLGLSFEKEEPDPLLNTIDSYLKKYHSPLINYSQNLIKEARAQEVDPLLLLAIAQCETNLGKKSPADCYNPFGLGIYGDKKLCFSSWEESFRTMSKTLRNKYHNQGLNSIEEIMIKYNPYSAQEKDGAWAKCVNSFYEEMAEF